MAITLYSGIPRSGKTYLLVYDLNEQKDNYFVIHNIDGLREGYLGEYGINFVDYCDKEKIEVIEFFSKEYQIKFNDAVYKKYNRHCLIIIDESHEWFDRNKKELKMWLSYHGHLNQTIWMVAHKVTNLSQIYRSYIEVEFRAKNSSIICIPGFFVYNRIAGGVRSGYIHRRKKKEIFDIYKSQNYKFVRKRPSFYIPIIIGLSLLGVSAFLLVPKYMFSKNQNKAAQSITEKKINNIESEKSLYRYAGNIGDKIMIEEISSSKVYEISEFPKLVLLSKNNNRLKVFDIETKKNFYVYRHTESVEKRAAERVEPRSEYKR